MPPPNPNPNWRNYQKGECDKDGNVIDRIYARDGNYVIYFSGCELFYETDPELIKNLGPANSALGRINRLLSWIDDSENKKDTWGYRHKYSTLELVGDALEMSFLQQFDDGQKVLNEIEDRLKTAEENKFRTHYQFGTVAVTVLAWILYACFHLAGHEPPYLIAAALGLAGGTFSVFLKLGSLPVNLNLRPWHLFLTGTTRSIIALLAGIALLLAMRSKMFAAIAYKGDPPELLDALKVAEYFFCFLAGFSESLVPNLLRDSEKENPKSKEKPTETPPPAPAKQAAPAKQPTAEMLAPGKQAAPAKQGATPEPRQEG
jgi:hypothetical protein